MPIGGSRQALRFRTHILVLTIREREKLHRFLQVSLQVDPGTKNFRLQILQMNGAAIEMRASMTAELNSTRVPILYLVPCQRKESSGAGCQVVVKLAVSFNGIRRNK